MPLVVFLSPTTASPPAGEVARDVRQVFAAEHARVDADGVTLITTDGAAVQLDAKYPASFVVAKLSPSFCRILFRSALKANATVGRGGSDRTRSRSRARRASRPVRT